MEEHFEISRGNRLPATLLRGWKIKLQLLRGIYETHGCACKTERASHTIRSCGFLDA